MMQRERDRLDDRLPDAAERTLFGRVMPRARDDGSRREREHEARIRVRDRDSTYRLRPSEAVLVQHVGVFRSIDVLDLERFAYSGDRSTCREDVRLLTRRGLVAEVTSLDVRSGRLDRIATPTRAGAGVARAQMANPRQVVYSGFGRPQQIRHDAAVYRMYQAEAARIERSGGRVLRVMLENELARGVRGEVAEHGLVAVSGVLQIPDLRIEYERAIGDVARVDLELATAHYSGARVAAKGRAGCTIYAAAADVASLRAAVATEDRFVEVFPL